MSTKKLNARIQKWRTMLSTGLFKDKQLLCSRVRKGIPPSIRMIVWPELVQLQKYIEQHSTEYNFDKLINSFSNNVYEISLDIPRTFPQEQDSKVQVLRKSMNNVLKGISIVHPKIGYCQGMNFLALRVLEVLSDQQAFWLLDYLFSKDRYLKNNVINPQHVELHNANFQQLLNRYSPYLLPALKEKGLHLYGYTMKCFMTLFSSVLSQQFFNRVFEVYLMEGWSIIYAVAVELFKRNEKQFMKMNMEEIHVFLGKKVYEVDDIDSFMNDAYKLNIHPILVKDLEEQYMGNLRESQKIRRNQQLEKQEHQNRSRAPVGRVPQTENIGSLVFQSKTDEVNFDVLYILKNQH